MKDGIRLEHVLTALQIIGAGVGLGATIVANVVHKDQVRNEVNKQFADFVNQMNQQKTEV